MALGISDRGDQQVKCHRLLPCDVPFLFVVFLTGREYNIFFIIVWPVHFLRFLVLRVLLGMLLNKFLLIGPAVLAAPCCPKVGPSGTC